MGSTQSARMERLLRDSILADSVSGAGAYRRHNVVGFARDRADGSYSDLLDGGQRGASSGAFACFLVRPFAREARHRWRAARVS